MSADPTKLTAYLEDLGLVVLGHFKPDIEDGMPLDVAQSIQQVVLIGNGGSALWPKFKDTNWTSADPLNQWTKSVLDPLASEFAGQLLYPFDGPPYYPFQRWAKRSGTAWSSPLGILLHQDYGLWHAYRAALLLPEPLLGIASPQGSASPCETCEEKPCLSGCPVSAFKETGYDVPVCWDYLETASGRSCMSRGCAARRACPIGKQHIYEADHAAFHMSAFLAARPVPKD